jgi:hypothetical protein
MTADETYRKAHHDLMNHLAAQVNLLCVLVREVEVEPLNWGIIGNLNHVSELLGQAIEAVPARASVDDDAAWLEQDAENRRNREMARGW